MNSYNKQALDILAKEQGFIRDNLEKVTILPSNSHLFHKSTKSAFHRFVLNSYLF